MTQIDAPQSTSTRPTAPGTLGAVQGLINTVDIEAGTDVLTTTGELSAWLQSAGLTPARIVTSDDELRRMRALREALRGLLLTNTGEPLDPAAAIVLAREAERCPVRLRVAEGARPDLAPLASGVDGAIARLLAAIAVAAVDGSWERLKVCRDDVCRWAFYDSSRNGSGSWCTMAVCGNRAKARRFRARRAGQPAV